MIQKIFVFSLFVGLLGGVFTQTVFAGSAASALGWMWGGSEEVSDATGEDTTGLGWISLNSLNCDADDDGLSDGAANCPTSGDPVADYGVFIPGGDGDLNGYAWSENVGWISFQPTDLIGCPSAPCGAYRVGNDIYGWARVVSIRSAVAASNAGGYEGWIRLRSDAGVTYGLTIDTSTTPNEINGYIWSDEFGWIEEKGATMNASESLIVCPPASTISVTGQAQLRAYYRSSGRILSCSNLLGSDVDVTTAVGTNWNSNNETFVTVDNSTGIVTGVATGGPVDVTASYLGDSATSLVTVNSVTSLCGNGAVDAGEACDEGVSANGACGLATTIISSTDLDGNGILDDTCSTSCQINVCQCTI